jgi:hypothetical protein
MPLRRGGVHPIASGRKRELLLTLYAALLLNRGFFRIFIATYGGSTDYL